MDDPITTADVLLQLGTAAVGGVFGAGIALLTVWLTQRGDRNAAKLAESRVRAESLHQEARHAAEQVHRAVSKFEQAVHDSGSDTLGAYLEWSREWMVQIGIIHNGSIELRNRIHVASRELARGVEWLAQALAHQESGMEIPVEIENVRRQIANHVDWIGQNIIVFRIGADLSAVDGAPPSIELPLLLDLGPSPEAPRDQPTVTG